MKKLFFALLMIFGSMVMNVSPAAAQDADVMKQAMEGYKNMNSAKANVKKTVHSEMVTKDVVTTGTFWFKKPAKMCISTNNGKDKLVTDGSTFTMVQDGKAMTANGKGNSALTPLVSAIKAITSGSQDVDLSDVADVDIERNGNLMVMTLSPIVKNAAERKKMLYQSFVITIDQKAGELRSIRLNGKGKNWEQYDFSNFQMNCAVDDAVFEVK